MNTTAATQAGGELAMIDAIIAPYLTAGGQPDEHDCRAIARTALTVARKQATKPQSREQRFVEFMKAENPMPRRPQSEQPTRALIKLDGPGQVAAAPTAPRPVRSGPSPAHQDRDVWYFQGDGGDHVESMGRNMVVVIHAGDLRALIAPKATGQVAQA